MDGSQKPKTASEAAAQHIERLRQEIQDPHFRIFRMAHLLLESYLHVHPPARHSDDPPPTYHFQHPYTPQLYGEYLRALWADAAEIEELAIEEIRMDDNDTDEDV